MFVQFPCLLGAGVDGDDAKGPTLGMNAMQATQATHVPSEEQTMIARGHLNVIRNVLMEERSSPAWSPSPMQPECQVLTVNIPRGEQTHFDSSDNILENTLSIIHIAKQ